MHYEQLSPRSFALIASNESGEIKTVYTLPDKFTLWQVGRITRLVGELIRSCSKSGAVLLNTLLASLNSGDSTNTEKLKAVVQQIEQSAGGSLGVVVLDGIGDILMFLTDENRVPLLAATLFVRPGETKLDPATLEERAALFEAYIEPAMIWEGLTDFFGLRRKMSEPMTTPTPTSEVKMKKSASRTSAKSTPA